METNRTIQAILVSYSSDQIYVEDELEKTINNSTISLEIKVEKVKILLDKLTKIEQSVAKLQSMLSPKNNNEEKTK
jgi:hypothetical protein